MLSSHANFYLLSHWQSLVATGKLFDVELPTDSTGRLERNAVVASVKQALTKAQNLGQENPLLVGAFAFDDSVKAQVYIPQAYNFSSKENLMAELAQVDAVATKPLSLLIARQLCPPDKFMANVRQAVAQIKQNKLHKVVLAQQQLYEFDRAINSIKLLRKLWQTNYNNYCFHLPTAEGVLVGASPELIVRSVNNQVTSFPLAGSAKRLLEEQADSQQGKNLLNSAKDLDEHKFVVDVIKSDLAPLVSELNIPATPELVKTAKMWHLGSKITARLANAELGCLDVLMKIFPTAALCGFPRQQANQFIKKTELVPRNLFAGAIGWCDSQGNGDWVVVIRSALINNNQARLFAGAGIVAQSDPTSEWQETQNKMQVMLSALMDK